MKAKVKSVHGKPNTRLGGGEDFTKRFVEQKGPIRRKRIACLSKPQNMADV